MSFYNPYSKYPDIGSGLQDVMQSIIQMIILKKMGLFDKSQKMQIPTQVPGVSGRGNEFWQLLNLFQQPGVMPPNFFG